MIILVTERELLKRILEELGAIDQKIDRFERDLRRDLHDTYTVLRRLIMSKTDDILNALNKATNDVAAEITKLKESLGSSISADQAAQFDAIAARLEGLAADPQNPVPQTPQTPTAPENPPATTP